jgi:putative ABC transport system permease protein
VGVAREIGGRSAYVPKAAYDARAGTYGGGRLVRMTFVDDGRRQAAIGEVENALARAGLPVEQIAPLTTLYTALVGHVEVPVRMLIAAAVLLAMIGGLGLASMMSVNVIERTREFGIRKAVGALPSTIVKIVLSESVAIAVLSWLIALVMALPLTATIGSFATEMFGTRLPFTLSWAAALLWLAFAIAIALIASAAPALRASRLIVRQALAYT